VYFISGLGADERIFKHIQLPADFQGIYLPWIKPLVNESLESYAQRLSEGIDTSEVFFLVGLSLGGMIASEIALHHRAAKTILISSIPAAHFLPWYYKLSRFLKIHRWLPVSMIKHAAWIKRLFSPETSEDKKMLKNMIRDCDPSFIRWGLHAILMWKNESIPSPLIHIHGTADKILPFHFTKPTHVIKNGGHLMVLNKAREINQILAAEMEETRY
jgi:pimeloyl-ACP methyl ester carboxylesterase